jgi:hypothetical protein
VIVYKGETGKKLVLSLKSWLNFFSPPVKSLHIREGGREKKMGR